MNNFLPGKTSYATQWACRTPTCVFVRLALLLPLGPKTMSTHDKGRQLQMSVNTGSWSVFVTPWAGGQQLSASPSDRINERRLADLKLVP